MEPDSDDTETLYTFDFGIESGNVISDSDYIWCACDKEGLQIKNFKETTNELTPHHHFGIASNHKYSLKLAKDFEFNNQRYLLIALEVNKHHQLLVLFKVSISKVICAFRVPFKVTQIEILVRNRHFIDNDKNPSFLRNFEVSAICGCIGGAICIFDVTPNERLVSLQANEYSPLDVHWIDQIDLTDYDEVQTQRLNALNSAKLCGLVMNRSSISEQEFMYKMPDETVSARIPNDQVKISSMKYEKQIDSLLIGFNFACFQIWNMKTLTIESSSEYGENNRPIVGFSLMQPQNDPKKCVYLMIAHSSLHNIKSNTKSKEKPAPQRSSARFSRCNLDESNDISSDRENDLSKNEQLDTDDDEETDSSFVIIYQLMFGKRVNIYLNQNDTYMLYEGLNYCALVFQHKLTSETLQCVKTNFSNEFNMASGSASMEAQHRVPKTALSKIISIKALNVMNDRLQMDLTCIVWALIDKNSPNSGVNYYFSLFNLNNWYVQCMPSKLKPLSEFSSVDGTSRKRKNIFFSNYSLAINNDLDSIKFITVMDSKIKRMKNNGIIGGDNPITGLMKQVRKTLAGENGEAASNNTSRVLGEESYSDEEELDLSQDDDTHLSMSFDLLILTAFNLFKLSIQPVEQQIHELISKQEDLIHYPERIYQVLSRYHLIDKYRSRQMAGKPEAKFIPVLNYLLETSQIYPILKSLWKLSMQDTSILSDFSLKAVLDWSWSKVVKLKEDINNMYRILSIKAHHYLNRSYSSFGHDVERHHLNEYLNYYNLQLENLIQVFKQFIKMHTTEEGHAELNKKLCVIQSIKCFVEHLQLFHKFELVMPPSSAHMETEIDDTLANSSAAASSSHHNNYMKEMQINLKIIKNRWKTRRAEQRKLRENVTGEFTENQAKYPFTYMIDCIIEECKLYANTSTFLMAKADEDGTLNNYPPSVLFELFEVCLECNLSTKMKQVVILYLLCDLMHTEMSPLIQKHILRLINSYCSTSFTLLSTHLDSTICLPWSSSATSITSLSTNDNENSTDSSCLFDLVNGLYLIDSQFLERAFKYLRVTDLSYLESYEKYFILYNSMHVNDFKIAAQYLWLFQKVNSALMDASGEIDSGRAENTAQDDDYNNKVLFKFFTRSTVDAHGSSVSSLNAKYEQRMHLRLLITIYLANSLVNEAYEFTKQSTVSAAANSKLNKELIIHFFVEAERFKLWKQVIKLSSSDHELLSVIFAYLEAKQDLNSICIAIDLHVTNRNYTKAIQLFERYSKQIHNSEFNYLTSMIEIAKEMVSENATLSIVNSKNSKTSQQQTLSITPADIRETAQFVYTFTTPLSEICKFSKRCINLIKANDHEDNDYIELLKLPLKEAVLSRFAINPAAAMLSGLGDSGEQAFPSIGTPSMLSKSIVKRKSSTPHPHSNFLPSTLLARHQNTPPILKSSNRLSHASEHKNRVLTSSLKQAGGVANSTTKSVKFQLSKFTRQISDENVDETSPARGAGIDDEDVENEKQQPAGKNAECKKLFTDDDEDEENDEKWFSKSKDEIIQNISLTGLGRRSRTPEVTVNFQLDQANSVSRKSINLIDLRTPAEEAMAKKLLESPKSSQSPPKSASFISESFKLALDKSSGASPNKTTSSITITKRLSTSPKSGAVVTTEHVEERVSKTVAFEEDAAAASSVADELVDSDEDEPEPAPLDKKELSKEDHDTSMQELLSYAHTKKTIRISELDASDHRASPVDLNKSSYYEDVDQDVDQSQESSNPASQQQLQEIQPAEQIQEQQTSVEQREENLPTESEQNSEPVMVEMVPVGNAGAGQVEPASAPAEELNNTVEMECSFTENKETPPPPARSIAEIAVEIEIPAEEEPALVEVPQEISMHEEVNKSALSERAAESVADEILSKSINQQPSSGSQFERTEQSPVVIKHGKSSQEALNMSAEGIETGPVEVQEPSKSPEKVQETEPVHVEAPVAKEPSPKKSPAKTPTPRESPVKQSSQPTGAGSEVTVTTVKGSSQEKPIEPEPKPVDEEMVEVDDLLVRHPNLDPEKFKEISEYIKANEKLSPSKIDRPDEKDVSFGSNIIEGTIESDKEEESQANKGSTDNSFELNLSSVSAADQSTSPTKAPPKATRGRKAAAAVQPKAATSTRGRRKKEADAPEAEEAKGSRLGRSDSNSSLFSHLTSVSERIEKMKQAEETVVEEKPPMPARRGAAASRKKTHMMDDNELSVKKATEEAAVAAEAKAGPNKCTIRRRMSDLSSTSSSSEVSTASAAARAKLRANLQSLPQSFGSNDHEVRVTRSKLKALIEQPILPNPQEVHLESTRSGRSLRHLSTKKHQLEQVQEKDEPPSASTDYTSSSKTPSDEISQRTDDMSTVSAATNEDIAPGGTLRRKRNISNAQAHPPVESGAASRVTRSMTRSPSPSASSVISVASSVVSAASSAVSGAAKPGASKLVRPRRGRPKTIAIVEMNEQHDKTLQAEENEEEAEKTHNDKSLSPSNSVISLTSSVASSSLQLGSSRRPRRGAKTQPLEQQDLETYELKTSRAYSLRSKGETKTRGSQAAAETPDIVEIEDPGSQIRNARRTKVLKSSRSKEANE